MTDLCNQGIFQCAFDLVFGVGFAVLLLVVIANLIGLGEKK